ncbi:hypothetical protein [Pseudomonas jessenii]|nr:hypothetical protein [Pseudomonas jessenii]
MGDYTELRRSAEAATAGVWRYGPGDGEDENPIVFVDLPQASGVAISILFEADWATDADAKFVSLANPAAVLAMIAESEVFEDGMRSLASTLGAGGYNAEALTATQLVEKVQWGVNHLADTSGRLADELRAERDQLKAENELAKMRIKELDLLFGRYILAMRSALIEEEHGKGLVAAMQWIYNALAGPGELPPEGETDSQAYFDREIVAVDRGMDEVMAFHEARRAAMSKEAQ